MAGTAVKAYAQHFADAGPDHVRRSQVLVIDDIEALRADEKAPAATITLIDVTPEQYAVAKEAVDAYSAKEEHVDRETDVAMNFAYDVFKHLPLKRPYRSGLGGANVINYYADLGLLNRKLAKKDS